MRHRANFAASCSLNDNSFFGFAGFFAFFSMARTASGEPRSLSALKVAPAAADADMLSEVPPPAAFLAGAASAAARSFASLSEPPFRIRIEQPNQHTKANAASINVVRSNKACNPAHRCSFAALAWRALPLAAFTTFGCGCRLWSWCCCCWLLHRNRLCSSTAFASFGCRCRCRQCCLLQFLFRWWWRWCL